MSDQTFYNECSSEFWSKVKDELPAAHLEILMELLLVLDAEGEGTSSVRSRYKAFGQYRLQGQVTLLQHSIEVALLCLEKGDGAIVRDLAVIAGLGHDIGKLEAVHRGNYAAAMHAYRGAEYVSEVIGRRLSDDQAAEVVRAIRNHHISGSGSGAVHAVLRAADALARDSEEMMVVSEKFPAPVSYRKK